MSQGETAAPVNQVSTTCRVDMAVRGVTAIHWAPLMATVTYRLGNVSASRASLANVVRGVKPTILDLGMKAANLVTVTRRVLVLFSAKRMVVVSVKKGLWETVVTSVKRTISTTDRGQAVKSALRVTDW